jgi:hypothetical protein
MLYKHLGEKDELELRRETFRAIAHMTPDQFETFIEFLTNDVIQQYAKMFWETAGEIFAKIPDALRAANNLAGQAAPHVARLRGYLNSRGIRQ